MFFSDDALSQEGMSESELITAIAETITNVNIAFRDSSVDLVFEPVYVGTVSAVALGY